jgi:hypothetical protein
VLFKLWLLVRIPGALRHNFPVDPFGWCGLDSDLVHGAMIIARAGLLPATIIPRRKASAWPPLEAHEIFWPSEGVSIVTGAKMGTPGKLAVAALAGILVGLGASFAAPRSYASQTVLSLEGPPTAEARADLIHSLGERAWTRGALAHMIDNFDLYPGASANTSLQGLTTQMRKQISVTAADASDSYFFIRFANVRSHQATLIFR